MSKKTLIRVTRQFRFEMAHALYGYEGPCKNIHGHSYQLSVTVKGSPITDVQDPECGMVIDFSSLKKIVETHIVKPFDHALVLNKNTPHRDLIKNTGDGKTVLVDFQPTCENLLIHFEKLVRQQLPPRVQLHHLALRETADSCCEWHAEDND